MLLKKDIKSVKTGGKCQYANNNCKIVELPFKNAASLSNLSIPPFPFRVPPDPVPVPLPFVFLVAFLKQIIENQKKTNVQEKKQII